MSKDKKEPSGKAKRLRAARLAAVQSLYGIELSKNTVTRVVGEFALRGGTAELEELELAADSKLYHDIVNGVTDRVEDLDKILNSAMTNRKLERLEVIMRAILRCAAYELIGRGDIDAPVSISEYVTISTSFFEGKEPSFVNGVLDRVARTLDGFDFEAEPEDSVAEESSESVIENVAEVEDSVVDELAPSENPVEVVSKRPKLSLVKDDPIAE